MSRPNQLVWFRNDLRLADNSAWAAACETGGPLAGIYFFCDSQLQEKHDVGPARLDFNARNLACLRESLDALGVPLLCLEADTFERVPKLLARLCAALDVRVVHCNTEYAWNERERDRSACEVLKAGDVVLEQHTDQVLLDPARVCKDDGEPYKVFTPYRRAWLAALQPGDYRERKAGKPAPITFRAMPAGAMKAEEFRRRVRACGEGGVAALFPAGESAARERLDTFVAERLPDYRRDRDYPAREGTSGLSAYLSAGVLSPRACLRAALASNGGEADTGDEGVVTWITELVWREFYRSVLVGFPWVNWHLPFRRDTDRVPWRQDEKDFRRWCDGETGYPIVDAAQRQLNETGWMHNRLRMVSAMFLTKHLLIDWRWGERYFMQKLVDGDFASNNGGWQWSASTGTDAQPYFRIFNPVTQSEKFDANGEFIRKYVPELRDRKGKAIHQVQEQADLLAGDYPAGMVEHRFARERALAAFKGG